MFACNSHFWHVKICHTAALEAIDRLHTHRVADGAYGCEFHRCVGAPANTAVVGTRLVLVRAGNF